MLQAMNPRRLLLGLLAGAVVGFSIFGVLVYRASSVEHLEAGDAAERFAAVRSALRDGTPLLQVDDDGNVIRRTDPPAEAPRPLGSVGVLAYRTEGKRLITVDIPFWFFKLKGPAAQYVVEGTGLDLKRLGITAADLERHGPAIVLDQTRTNGDRLLVWTE